jgi:tetratricopeptide (TPR) repeat protein
VAFCRWLELYLQAADPARRYQCVNAGADSYASYRVVRLMRELVRHQPDLFVVYTGHNEFLEERTYGHLLGAHPARERLRVWLNGRRFFILARRALEERRGAGRPPVERLAGEVEAKLDDWTGLERYHRDPELERGVVEHFAHNLRQMVAIARDHGAAIAFVQPAANLKDFSPFKSQHPPALASAEVLRFTALLERGRELAAAADPRGALAALGEAQAIDPGYAELHFLAGRARLAAGDLEAARAAFVRAKDLDVAPLRAIEPLVELVGATARRADVPLVELPAILAAESQAQTGVPILGSELFLDHVHPTIAVHSLIAERLQAELAERGLVPAPPPAPERQAIYERVVGGLDRDYLAESDLKLAKVLGWAGKLREAEEPLRRAVVVLPDHPDARFELGVLYARTGRRAEALAELERAAALAPDFAPVRFNLGVVYGDLGRLDDGIAALRQAIRLRPDYAAAHHNLGALLRRRGDLEAAAAAYRRALELAPDAGPSRRGLGLVDLQAGRLDEAVRALEASVAADPQSAAARTDLGIAYARAERLADAAASLDRAVALEPSYAEAHFNLGLVRARQGDRGAAAAAYRRAIAADPRHAPAHNNLAIQLAADGEREGALRHLEAAIAAAPGWAEARFNLGVLYDGLGKPGEAETAIRQALELEPENSRFHLALGLLYAAQGRRDPALEHLRRARAGGAAVPDDVWRRLGA